MYCHIWKIPPPPSMLVFLTFPSVPLVHFLFFFFVVVFPIFFFFLLFKNNSAHAYPTRISPSYCLPCDKLKYSCPPELEIQDSLSSVGAQLDKKANETSITP